jgi:hypothetical protein
MSEDDRGDIPLADWKVLLKMWRRKTETTKSEFLGDIELDEWNGYLKKHAKITSSPGGTGTGSSLLKEAPEKFTLLVLTIFSALVGMKVIPRSWKQEIVVPIPKKLGALRLADLRPLKLLEVARKLVFGIIKDRLQKHINGLRILNSRQFGFRSLRGTPHAGLAATAAFEDALRRQMEIHAVFLDIKKA